MLSQQQYTKELAEAERYHNSAARQHQSNDAIRAMLEAGGSSPNNNNNKQQYTDEENEAYNTIINNIKDPQELYAILHEMKQKRLHRTANNNNSKPRRHRYKRQQKRSKSKRRVSRGSSSSDDTPTLDTPSSTTESSTSFIDTLSNLLFPFHSIFQDTNNDNDTLDEQQEDTQSSSFSNILSYLGYDNSNDAGHYECGSASDSTNGESSCSSSFDSSTNLVDSFNIFNILWNKKKNNSSNKKYYRRSSSVSSSSAISPSNVEDSWVTKDELNEW